MISLLGRNKWQNPKDWKVKIKKPLKYERKEKGLLTIICYGNMKMKAIRKTKMQFHVGTRGNVILKWTL
jgi:hypothetical protein